MLSNSNEIDEIKFYLNDYDYYNISSDTNFNTMLSKVVDKVKYNYIYPQVGSSLYDIIALKDGDFDYDYERYIYNSEVYYSVAIFLDIMFSKSQQSNEGSSRSLKVEGYETSSSGQSGVEKSSIEYFQKAMFQMNLAGYNTSSLSRYRKSNLNEFIQY